MSDERTPPRSGTSGASAIVHAIRDSWHDHELGCDRHRSYCGTPVARFGGDVAFDSSRPDACKSCTYALNGRSVSA